MISKSQYDELQVKYKKSEAKHNTERTSWENTRKLLEEGVDIYKKRMDRFHMFIIDKGLEDEFKEFEKTEQELDQLLEPSKEEPNKSLGGE